MCVNVYENALFLLGKSEEGINMVAGLMLRCFTAHICTHIILPACVLRCRFKQFMYTEQKCCVRVCVCVKVLCVFSSFGSKISYLHIQNIVRAHSHYHTHDCFNHVSGSYIVRT